MTPTFFEQSMSGSKDLPAAETDNNSKESLAPNPVDDDEGNVTLTVPEAAAVGAMQQCLRTISNVSNGWSLCVKSGAADFQAPWTTPSKSKAPSWSSL